MDRTDNRLFDRLLDDAALFPPAQMDLASALPAHLRHKESWYGRLVGPFVCTDTKLPELEAAGDDSGAGQPIETSIVVTGGPGALSRVAQTVENKSDMDGPARAEVVAYEVPLGAAEAAPEAARELAAALKDLPRGKEGGVPVYAEVPWQDKVALEEALEIVAGCGARAKLRTGGLTGAAFPSEEEVARFITAAVSRQLVFKCTAGLHGAVRGRRGGWEQMGFVNVMLATAASLDGAKAADVAQVLAERDEERVVKEVMAIPATVRSSFASIGTCSVSEPVDELVRLGLLDSPV